MKQKTFLEFVQNKKEHDNNPISSKIVLGDGNDFKPLVVSDEPNSQFYGNNKNLAKVIKAFKQGANWGWSKDEKSGEDKPVKIGGKKLFLTGGALRDHLSNKKPRNVELITSASPDEVFHILSQNNFLFAGDEDDIKHVPKKTKYFFYVTKHDKSGRPYKFSAVADGQKFDIDVFDKRSLEDVYEPATHAEDAANRDFTINAMSLLLNNENGPNKDLYDFHGGLRDLASSKISSIGDVEDKFSKDPIRALRYARMLSRYGNLKNLSHDEKIALKKAMHHVSKLDPKIITDEFSKGLDYPDQDIRRYLNVYNNLGLMPYVFPNIDMDVNIPPDIRDVGDKHAHLAYMMRFQDPNHVEKIMSKNWTPKVAKKIKYLIHSLRHLHPEIDHETLDHLTKDHLMHGLPDNKFKVWITKAGNCPHDVADAYIKHVNSPRVQIYKPGSMEPTPAFEDLHNPFENTVSHNQAELRRKKFELDNFRKHLNRF